MALGIVVVLLLLVSGLAFIDARLRGWVESEAAARLERGLPQVGQVEVTLDGFPFTLGVLLHGEVQGLHVHVDRLSDRGLEATGVRLDVERISLDGDALLGERRVVVTGIGEARMEASIPVAEIETFAGHPIMLHQGTVHARVGRRYIELRPEIYGPWLVLRPQDSETISAVGMPLPSRGLLCPPVIEVLEDRLRLSCSTDRLPSSLRYG